MLVRLAGERPPGPLLCVEVTDTGIGIPEETVGRLFGASVKPILRRRGSTAARGSGWQSPSGSRRCSAATSRRGARGRGSTFTLTIQTGPLDSVEMPSNLPPVSAVDRPCRQLGKIGAGERILLAEDSADNQRIIPLILAKAGFQVDLAENGRVACDKALQAVRDGTPYDLIVMDMQMPVMEGCEATRQLRAAGCTRPIVALTAHATVEDRKRCLEAGCDYYVTKPINRDQLLLVTADCLGVRDHSSPRSSPGEVDTGPALTR